MSATKRRKKGDLEWVRLGDLVPGESGLRKLVPIDEVEVAIEHVGPADATRMERELQGCRLRELRRILKEREGLTIELAPQLYERSDANPRGFNPDAALLIVTPEGVEDAQGVLAKIVGPVAADARGLDLDPALEGAERRAAITAELLRLGVLPPIALRAMEVQAVLPAQFPVAAGPGLAGPGD